MNTIFLLGAGFTYDISNGKFPLLKDINQRIVEKVDKDLSERYGFGKDDFEICLTRLDINLRHTFANKTEFDNEILESLKFKKRLEENRNRILSFLANLFSIQGETPKPNSTSDKFINNILKDNDIILTTNYDCYLENLLGPKQWSFDGGYGRRLRWFLNPDENSKLRNIKIFKLHGSAAFVIVPFGEDYKGDVEISINKKEFPCFYSELSWGNQEGSYLILPSFIKPIEFRSISEVYQESIENMKLAKRLIIIGSSLREEDYILWLILSFFDREGEVIIVDPNAKRIKEQIIDTLVFPDEKIITLQGTLTDKIDDLAKCLKNK